MAGSTLAKESSEQANLTAPLKCPSSSFPETRVARPLMGSWGRGTLRPGRPWPREAGGSCSLSICSLMAGHTEPKLEGTLRQRLPKRRKRSQEAWSWIATTASRIVVNFNATRSLEFLGILLMILHLYLGGKESRGRPDRSGEDGFTVVLTLVWARGALDGDEAPTRDAG